MEYHGVFQYTTLTKLFQLLGQPETVFRNNNTSLSDIEYRWKSNKNRLIIHCFPYEVIYEYENRIHFWISHYQQDLNEALLLSEQLQERPLEF